MIPRARIFIFLLTFNFSVLNVQPVITSDVQQCSLSPYATRAVNWNSVVDNFSSPFGTFGPFDEHLCSSGGKTRTAKNIDGSDLHLLSAGSNRAYHLLIPLHEERHRRKDPAFSCFRG